MLHSSVVRRLLRLHRISSQCRFRHQHRFISTLPSVGDTVHNFTVIDSTNIKELDATAIHLRHRTCGAHYVHVARDDINNVFAIAFRTPPPDSSGVTHILEHTVLCGSQRYPVRDPFFRMLNRSLATFMNAFTASDWTMYPFSTCNTKDFDNLLRVYMDAVLNPLLKQNDFCQEGWRLEHKDVADPDSPIVFKGVVFNEMKGALSDKHRLLMDKAQRALLSSNCYSHCSGGEPLHIPSLSWQNLKEFHSNHYHFNNCRIFSYGNFSLNDHLHLLDSEYMSVGSGKSSVQFDTSIGLEPRWQKPRTQTIFCRPDSLSALPKQRQNSVSVSYLLNDVLDRQQTFNLKVLCELLVSGPNSAFYQAIIESNLATDFISEMTGLDDSNREVVFSVGFQGVDRDNIQKLLHEVDRVLERVVNEDFEEQRIKAILHQTELRLKHQSGNFGLGLLLHSISEWIHSDSKFLHTFQFNQIIGKFRELHASGDSRFLQKLVQKYLINNPHRLVTIMHVDEDFEAREHKQEALLLERHLEALDDAGRSSVYRDGLRLAEEQKNTNLNVQCLPMLRVDDIPLQHPVHTTRWRMVNDAHVQICEQPTNGLTYFRGLVDVSHVPMYLKPLLPLYCSLLAALSSEATHYRDIDKRIRLCSGGFNVVPSVREHVGDVGLFEDSLEIGSYCLLENCAPMFALWSEILSGTRFDDTERVRTLLQMYHTQLSEDVTINAHSYAMGVAGEQLGGASKLRQLYFGLKQIRYAQTLVESLQLDLLIAKLRTLHESVFFNRKDDFSARFSLVTTANSVDIAQSSLESFINNLDLRSNSSRFHMNSTADKRSANGGVEQVTMRGALHTYVVLPLPVHFCAMCLPTVPLTHPDAAPLAILARYLSISHLHREIRERGGAYGGGARVSSSSATWSFYSYRDPQTPEHTLSVFREAGRRVLEGEWAPSEADVDGARIGVFQSIDAPVAPPSRGMREFLYGLDDATFGAYRQRLREVTAEDLVRVAAEYLVRADGAAVCVLGKSCDTLDAKWTVEQS